MLGYSTRRLLQKIFLFRFTISKDQSYRAESDRNKIVNERQVNNYDIRIDREMCTLYIYIPEYPNLILAGEGGGRVRPPRSDPLNPPVSIGEQHIL